MKKIFVLTFLILALFATTCSAAKTAKSSPAEDVQTLCAAILHGDEVSLEKIGMTKADYTNLINAELQKQYSSMNEFSFTESQKEAIGAVILDIFQRSDFSTKTVSESGKKATVKITVSIFEKINDDYLSSKLAEYVHTQLPADFNINNLSKDEETQLVADILVFALENVKIVGYEDITVKCKYSSEDKMWAPVDKNFGELIVKKMLNEV